MENNLWFNQVGESYNGIPCETIYGGCPITEGGQAIVDSNSSLPISSGIPYPNNDGTTSSPDVLDPGYLQVLADGSVVDANGNLISSGTTEGLEPAQPLLEAGQRVRGAYNSQCPPGESCPTVMSYRTGTVTGNMLKTLPPKYEILWDHKQVNGQSGFYLASDLEVINDEIYSNIDKMTVPVEYDKGSYLAPVVVSSGCGDDQYTIPFKIQGEEKCVDKTIALVLGAIAIYYIMKKDK